MKYQELVSVELSSPSGELLSCSDMNCSSHNHLLDVYADHVASTLKKCASCCFPLKIPSKRKKVVGWNNSARNLRKASNFWHKVWAEAGYLTSIKIQAKKQYKYEVRHLKQR